MDGLYQDLIILLAMLFFGFWVIKKHYDNAWKIEQLEKARDIGDLKKMESDIIELKQNCINIDAKYKIEDEWTVTKIEELAKIAQGQFNLQDALNTFQTAKENLEYYEKGAGITMDSLSDMESDDV